MLDIRLRQGSPSREMVFIPGGTFMMGSDHHYPEEAPAHEASVEGFWIDRYAITNAEFERFVGDTGYITSAERDTSTCHVGFRCIVRDVAS